MKPASAGATEFAGMRILLVEDTAIVADEIARLLRMRGCTVVGPLGTLPLALTGARNEQGLDGAFLDINLEGQEVFPAARMLAERHIPFIFLTGYTHDSIPADLQDHPCLEKPFSACELETVLRTAFRPVRGTPNATSAVTVASQVRAPTA